MLCNTTPSLKIGQATHCTGHALQYYTSLKNWSSHSLCMQDVFQPISSLISGAGVTVRWALQSHAIRWLDFVLGKSNVSQMGKNYITTPMSHLWVTHAIELHAFIVLKMIKSRSMHDSNNRILLITPKRM